jgi:D-alanyl-lipoteichoic acid acyltransferase DltB (MBOAT superfamily)
VQNIVAQGHLFPSVNEFCKMISTFILISFSWIFFRANDMQHAVQYISSVFTEKLFSLPQYNPVILYKCLLGFIILEWIGREHKYAIANLGQKWPRLMRWSVYYFFVFLICYFAGTKEQFIYFQF